MRIRTFGMEHVFINSCKTFDLAAFVFASLENFRLLTEVGDGEDCDIAEAEALGCQRTAQSPIPSLILS